MRRKAASDTYVVLGRMYVPDDWKVEERANSYASVQFKTVFGPKPTTRPRLYRFLLACAMARGITDDKEIHRWVSTVMRNHGLKVPQKKRR